MRFQSLGRHHAIDLAFGIKEDFAFWQVEVDRATLVTGFGDSSIGLP